MASLRVTAAFYIRCSLIYGDLRCFAVICGV